MTHIQRFKSKFYIFLLIIVSSCSKISEDCMQYDLIPDQNNDNLSQVIAHSHNDYEQTCPLTKALALGFTSIEVDIFPYKETIVVSHDDDLLDVKPTIQLLYLDPLKDIVQRTDQKINLLVDLKVYNDNFLNQLHTLLKNYDDILITRTDTSKNVKIILSGKLPRKEIVQNEMYNFFFLDGRLTDLGKDIDSNTMPLISANFSDIFDVKPSQVLTTAELETLITDIQRTHDEGKIIRFWNTSDNDVMWSQLIESGVDVIGVDHLEEYHEFISGQ